VPENSQGPRARRLRGVAVASTFMAGGAPAPLRDAMLNQSDPV
jgi:hypothetical protein